jgi:hypothetical protein
MLRPSQAAHGTVWKVVVNGKDAQDEFDKLDPLGVAKQKFEVYFNRAMDIKFSPTVSMGVRYPYSQTAIAEQSKWSADSTIYTVYGTVGLTTGDGINTIRVVGAKDNDHFEIPIEDRRFRVVVNAAGSASSEFQAKAGLGKVNLEWNNTKLADGFGFNMYRMEKLNDTTLTKPVLINKQLIADTLYTDFAVTPGKKYYYYYKIVRSSLAETDSSKIVSTTPLTASKGDANGDLKVDVLDITTLVSYLLNKNPQPFIAEAADVNSDTFINVLDVVGVVNKVLNPGKAASINLNQQAHLYMQNDTLFADAPVAIGGIQFDVKGVYSVEEITRLKALTGFESGYSQKADSLRLLYYSISGKTIAAGIHIPLLKIKKGSTVSNIVMADNTGSPILTDFVDKGTQKLSENLTQGVAELGQNYSNPFDQNTIIPVHLFEPVDEATIRFVNVLGQVVDLIKIPNPTKGDHLIPWNAGQNKGVLTYSLEIRRGTQILTCPVKKMVAK